jgi:hypothetical protein
VGKEGMALGKEHARLAALGIELGRQQEAAEKDKKDRKLCHSRKSLTEEEEGFNHHAGH